MTFLLSLIFAFVFVQTFLVELLVEQGEQELRGPGKLGTGPDSALKDANAVHSHLGPLISRTAATLCSVHHPIPVLWFATERLIIQSHHPGLIARQQELPIQNASINGLRGADSLREQDRGALRAPMAIWWTRWSCISGLCVQRLPRSHQSKAEQKCCSGSPVVGLLPELMNQSGVTASKDPGGDAVANDQPPTSSSSSWQPASSVRSSSVVCKDGWHPPKGQGSLFIPAARTMQQGGDTGLTPQEEAEEHPLQGEQCWSRELSVFWFPRCNSPIHCWTRPQALQGLL